MIISVFDYQNKNMGGQSSDTNKQKSFSTVQKQPLSQPVLNIQKRQTPTQLNKISPPLLTNLQKAKIQEEIKQSQHSVLFQPNKCRSQPLQEQEQCKEGQQEVNYVLKINQSQQNQPNQFLNQPFQTLQSAPYSQNPQEIIQSPEGRPETDQNQLKEIINQQISPQKKQRSKSSLIKSRMSFKNQVNFNLEYSKLAYINKITQIKHNCKRKQSTLHKLQEACADKIDSLLRTTTANKSRKKQEKVFGLVNAYM